MPDPERPVLLVILADDLTGAADSAARCCSAGMAAAIAVQPPTAPLGCDALALTSDSRHLPAPLAAQRVRTLLAGLALPPDTVWYKKIDSTGRGNLGSEIDALLDGLGRPYAIVCPAFPAHGRGLRSGTLVWPHAPAPPLHVPSLLARQSQHPVTALDLQHVRLGAAHLLEQVRDATRDGQRRLLVLDAVTDDDLATIAAAAIELLPRVLLCGSAGLVGALAARLSPAGPPRVQPMPSGAPGSDRPAVVVVGSGSQTAHRQIAYAHRHGHVRAVDIRATATRAWTGDTVLHLPPPAAHTKLDDATARSRAHELADAALATLERDQAALLILAGGDTAMVVLERLGIVRLTVVRELLPGMPLTRAVDGTGRERWVVLKAGNHGDESTLVTLLQQLRSLSTSEAGYGTG